MTSFSMLARLPVGLLVGLGSGCVHRSSTSPPSPPATSTVTAEDIQRAPDRSIEQMLMGHFPGVEVTREVRTPLLCYTGDTSPAGLDAYPPVFEAKILITELSFVRPNHRREKIHKFGHMHLDDFIERADRFKNELIVCAHFSTRYHPQEVRKLLDAKLPEALRARMKVWL